ncbi:MAG TPA: ribosome maturation factor RimM [Smithella sp.]|nr:ribosome maturation factor RimM [Smithella sp.]HNY51645.1 ribosome maturation factor RimM [Smithella sp.]HOG91770.1 ribosome maturation factor RimM [Smithella sp.]
MNLFEAGEIVKTRGLRGCLKVLSYLETGSIAPRPDVIYIEEDQGQKQRYELKKIDLAGKAFFIELKEIDDVEAAKNLVGRKVYFSREILKKLPEGEYYYHDIIGINVYSQEGNFIGTIESVFPTGSNDVYICKSAGREILLPAISDVIKRIDIDQRMMIVVIPEGLL